MKRFFTILATIWVVCGLIMILGGKLFYKRDILKLQQNEVDCSIEYIEKAIGCPITYISVGPERDSIIYRKGAMKND